MTRQEANLKIVKLLEVLIMQVPDFRFAQLLVNLDISTMYYEESEETLNKVVKALERIQSANG